MPLSVRDICEAFDRNQLLGASEMATLRTQWFKTQRQDAEDPAKFARWLVANRYATDFVMQAVLAGKASQLVFKQYHVQDRLNSGPMAGALLASDQNDRKVAIEILTPDMDEATALGIFQVIMKTVQLRHPNVGSILEFNEANQRRYIVKQYHAGDTLASVLAKRGKLSHGSAARLFTLAFTGLQALHDRGIPGGDLDPECLLIAKNESGAKGRRTVKILHAGVKRKRFDNTAPLGAAAPQAIEEDIKFQTTFGMTSPDKVVPERDLFRLGCAFYQAVTGRAPYTQDELAQPTRKAIPVRQLDPHVPSMLAEIIADLVDPDPAHRPKKASHVSKALRVYLASEEDELVQPEEDIVMTEKNEIVEPIEEEKPEVYAFAEKKPKERRVEKEEKPRAERGFFPPKASELVYLALGVNFILVLMLVVHLLTNWTFASLACLMAGFAGSFLLDRLLAFHSLGRAGRAR